MCVCVCERERERRERESERRERERERENLTYIIYLNVPMNNQYFVIHSNIEIS